MDTLCSKQWVSITSENIESCISSLCTSFIRINQCHYLLFFLLLISYAAILYVLEICGDGSGSRHITGIKLIITTVTFWETSPF